MLDENDVMPTVQVNTWVLVHMVMWEALQLETCSSRQAVA